MKNRDILILAGDIQPMEEEACYTFCEKILDIMQEYKGKEIITLGGIGLHSEPKKPKVYCTSNNKECVKKFKKSLNLHDKLFGIVGPIIGVSGLLVGLAKKRKIDGIALLAETSAHPMHIGIKGAKEIIEILNKEINI